MLVDRQFIFSFWAGFSFEVPAPVPVEPVAAGVLPDVEAPLVVCVDPPDVDDVPVVVDAPVVVRVPERTFTLVEVLRPGSTTTPLLVRFLITVVLLSGAVAITRVRFFLAYFFFFLTTVTDEGRSSVTVTCCRERLRTTTSGLDSLRTETLDPERRVVVCTPVWDCVVLPCAVVPCWPPCVCASCSALRRPAWWCFALPPARSPFACLAPRRHCLNRQSPRAPER